MTYADFSMPPEEAGRVAASLYLQSGIVSALSHLFTFVHSQTPVTRMVFYLRDADPLPVQPIFSIAVHEDGRWEKQRLPEELPSTALPSGVSLTTSAHGSAQVLSPLRFTGREGEYWQHYIAHKALLRTQVYASDRYAVYIGFFADTADAFCEALVAFVQQATHELSDVLRSKFSRSEQEIPDFHSGMPTAMELLHMCRGLESIYRKVQSIMGTDSTVLILGETGVGKEVVADAIHEGSHRRNGPFVKVNCGAIPETLIDSELFGHEKGAFTGAHTSRRGYFEQAHTGGIFLDEIGDLSPYSQARLLRVLEKREIQRVGSAKGIPLDIRIIAATNRPLARMVEQGAFREDLWYRLNVVPIHIPPLRMHLVDMPVLVHHFMVRKARMLGIDRVPVIHSEDMEVLHRHNWPGNIRELEFVVERALIHSATSKAERVAFEVQHRIPRQDREGLAISASGASQLAQFDQASCWPTMEEHINAYVRRVMERTGQRIYGPRGAAQVLGIHPSTLKSRLAKMGG